MQTYKEKQFLVFRLDDGKTVKYDLSTGNFIGKRGGNVSSLVSQLSNFAITDFIDGFPDEKYRNFLNFTYSESMRTKNYSTIGTFLRHLREYARFEQFFAAGYNHVSPTLTFRFEDIPRDILRLSEQYAFTLTNHTVRQYQLHKDIVRNIFESTYVSLTAKDIYELVLEDSRYFDPLILEYGYKYDALLRYVDNLITYEAISTRGVMREIFDYARMMKGLSHKFEKYPKNFLTTHRIAIRNYDRLKQTFKEELFLQRRNENLEFASGEYIIVYPPSTQSMKDEATQQQHCLASYIQTVIDGHCHILFMRNKRDPERSLVTLEVRNLQVVQAKGKFNRDLKDDEQEFVDLYNKKLRNLKI